MTATYRFIFCTTKDAFIRSPLSSLMTASVGASALPVTRELKFQKLQGLEPYLDPIPAITAYGYEEVNVRKCSSSLALKPYPLQTSAPHRSCNSASLWVWGHLRR